MEPSEKKIIRFPGFEVTTWEGELWEREKMIGKIEGMLGTMDRLAYLSTEDLRKIYYQIYGGKG